MEQLHGGNIYDMAQQHKLRADAIIDFSSNINPLGPSPRVLRALRSHLRWISRYPEIHAQGLVRDLARVHGLPEEAIVVGNGSTALIYRLPYALDDENRPGAAPDIQRVRAGVWVGGVPHRYGDARRGRRFPSAMATAV